MNQSNRNAYQRAYKKKYRTRADVKAKRAAYDKELPARPKLIIGVDGEGLTERIKVRGQKRPQKVHRYLYMAAWTPDEMKGELDLDPLYKHGTAEERTAACFEFLLALPQDALLLGFSLGYDYTKIFEGLPDGLLYDLPRPERRPGKTGPLPRVWGEWRGDDGTGRVVEGFYRLNYIKGRFSCAKVVRGEHRPKCEWKKCQGCRTIRRCVLWDIFAFFQGSFIKACSEWGVVTPAEYEELKAMKDKRGNFSREDWPKVIAYCGQECRKMAELATRLLEAHNDAGLNLRSYHGAGSTASAMLKGKFNARKYIAPPPDAMTIPVSCGFFGGRFEVSQVGPCVLPVWSYDIASAYPYQFTWLPCLACGTWKLEPADGGSGRLQRLIETAQAALVRYRLRPCDALKVNRQKHTSEAVWGPFPFRAWGLNVRGDMPRAFSQLDELPSNGCILYPATSGGGWVYRDEFLAGQRHFPNVEAVEAWVYNTSCVHNPFNDAKDGVRSTMPEQYKLRLEWGKEGRGIVVKLGTNSCYGKAAQSVGSNPPFQCFIWAGIVTSGCRAQLLDAMGCAKDWRNILGTATDGILSLERLLLAEPRDTGTKEAAALKKKYALGAWEEKEIPEGVHTIRPGIGFPLDTAKEIEVKARGIGKAVLAKHRVDVLRAWKKKPGAPFEVKRDMFFGMKSSVDPPRKGEKYPTRRANYGTWDKQSQRVSYDPFPKRPRQPLVSGASLKTWAFGQEHESAPYERLLPLHVAIQLRMDRRPIAGPSPQSEEEKTWETLLGEQPDRDDDTASFRLEENE